MCIRSMRRNGRCYRYESTVLGSLDLCRLFYFIVSIFCFSRSPPQDIRETRLSLQAYTLRSRAKQDNITGVGVTPLAAGEVHFISRVVRHQSLDFRILLACGNFSALARPRPHCFSSFKASPFIIISCKQGLYPYIKSTTARVDPCRQYDATSGTSSP